MRYPNTKRVFPTDTRHPGQRAMLCCRKPRNVGPPALASDGRLRPPFEVFPIRGMRPKKIKAGRRSLPPSKCVAQKRRKKPKTKQLLPVSWKYQQHSCPHGTDGTREIAIDTRILLPQLHLQPRPPWSVNKPGLPRRLAGRPRCRDLRVLFCCSKHCCTAIMFVLRSSRNL